MTSFEFYNLDEEVKERLCQKSKILFGSKWKWRKLIDKMTITVPEFEAQLDVYIDEAQKRLGRLNAKRKGFVRSAVSTGDTTTKRTDKGNVSTSTDSSAALSE